MVIMCLLSSKSVNKVNLVRAWVGEWVGACVGACVSACMGVCVRGCVRVCVNACWAKSRMCQSQCSGAEFAFWAKGWWPKEGQEVAFWYFLWEITFNSLNQLMDYHRTSSIGRIKTVYLKDMLPMVTAEYHRKMGNYVYGRETLFPSLT